MNLKPITEGRNEERRGREKLISIITESIRSGELADSEGRLPSERELAERLGVTRPLLREALIILDYLGVIEARGKLGTFLRSVGDTGFLLTNIQASAAIPSRALAQAYETRVFIEVPAAGLAAKRRSSNDLKRIEECLTNMEEQYRMGSYEVCGKTRWNTIFHSLIIRAARNDLFNRIFDGIYHVIEEATAAIRTKLTQAYVAEGWLERSMRQNREIFEALAASRRRDAERAMYLHLMDCNTVLLKLHGIPTDGSDEIMEYYDNFMADTGFHPTVETEASWSFSSPAEDAVQTSTADVSEKSSRKTEKISSKGKKEKIAWSTKENHSL